MLGLADAVIEGRRDDRSLVRSRLDISCPEEGLGALTSVVIAAYRAAHPNIDVVVHEETPHLDWPSNLLDQVLDQHALGLAPR